MRSPLGVAQDTESVRITAIRHQLHIGRGVDRADAATAASFAFDESALEPSDRRFSPQIDTRQTAAVVVKYQILRLRGQAKRALSRYHQDLDQRFRQSNRSYFRRDSSNCNNSGRQQRIVADDRVEGLPRRIKDQVRVPRLIVR